MWQPDHQAKQPVPLNSEDTQELHPFFTDRWLEGCFCEVCLVYYTGTRKVLWYLLGLLGTRKARYHPDPVPNEATFI